jgi:hypothetical protein
MMEAEFCDFPLDHPLRDLDGQRIGGVRWRLVTWPGRIAGQVGFLLRPEDVGGGSGPPLVEGLYGWVTGVGEGVYAARSFMDVSLATHLPGTSDPAGSLALRRETMGHLGAVLARTPHSWIYLAYGWKTLRQIQALRHPLPVTDEGYLLCQEGFRGGWKDYYYSESWLEGPMKLKAERAPGEPYRQAWDEETARSLVAFLAAPPLAGADPIPGGASPGAPRIAALDVEREARGRALELLPSLAVRPPLAGAAAAAIRAYPSPAETALLDAEALARCAARAGGAQS